MDGERDSGVWDLILGYLLAGFRLRIGNLQVDATADTDILGNASILIVKYLELIMRYQFYMGGTLSV